MQTFENLLLREHSTEFFDIANKQSLGTCNSVCLNGGATSLVCVIKVFSSGKIILNYTILLL